MKKLLVASVALCSLALLPLASGHSTGQESRTAADCAKLPGTDSIGERAQCMRCVSRPEKHHYHSDSAPGGRCKADSAKP